MDDLHVRESTHWQSLWICRYLKLFLQNVRIQTKTT